jgi:hypothetical protein
MANGILVTFLGRFWSTPSRVLTSFPIDRRDIAERPSGAVGKRCGLRYPDMLAWISVEAASIQKTVR